MHTFHRLRFTWLVLAALLVVAAWPVGGLRVAHAQGNLLQSPGFEGAYPGSGAISGGVPAGWQVWGNFQESNHENLPTLVRSGAYSWRLRSYGASPIIPTGGGYQTVSAQAGATYRFSIHALVWTCNDAENQCRTGEGIHSDETSGAWVRIGIDPSGGTNPNSGAIQWSVGISPFVSGVGNSWTQFQPISVEARASAGQITVFTQFAAGTGMRFNDVFFDDATLVAVSAPADGGSSGGNPAPAPPTAAPVVPNAQARPDGSQVHTVQAGQTLSSIALAYGTTVTALRQMNGMGPNDSLIFPGQALIVRAAPATATPPPTWTPFPTIPASITITPLPTVAAFASTPVTSDPVVVPVEPAAQAVDEGGDDNDSARNLVLILAVVVMGVAAITVGGFMAVALFFMFRRR